MSNFDDYFEDQSEAEQIIDDTIDKLVGLISEKTKSEIERYKNWYESSDKMRAELQKQVYEQQEKIKVLEIDLKRAKEELERKDNEIPRVPVSVVEVIKKCDCGGEFEYTPGMTQILEYPSQYTHTCNKCGKVKRFLRTYPYQRFKRNDR